MKPTEADLLVQVRWLLRLLKRQGLLDYTRIHVMPIVRGRRQFSKNDDMKGFFDIEVVVPPLGRAAYMELKSLRGTMNDDQLLFQASRRKVGSPAEQIRSFDEAVSFLKSLGVPVGRVLEGNRLSP